MTRVGLLWAQDYRDGRPVDRWLSGIHVGRRRLVWAWPDRHLRTKPARIIGLALTLAAIVLVTVALVPVVAAL